MVDAAGQLVIVAAQEMTVISCVVYRVEVINEGVGIAALLVAAILWTSQLLYVKLSWFEMTGN